MHVHLTDGYLTGAVIDCAGALVYAPVKGASNLDEVLEQVEVWLGRNGRQLWMYGAWDWLLKGDGLGLKVADPHWFDVPAVTKLPINSPQMGKGFDLYNRGTPATASVRHQLARVTAELKALGRSDPDARYRLRVQQDRLRAAIREPRPYQEQIKPHGFMLAC